MNSYIASFLKQSFNCTFKKIKLIIIKNSTRTEDKAPNDVQKSNT